MNTTPPSLAPSSNESNEDDDDPDAYGESPLHSALRVLGHGCHHFIRQIGSICRKDPLAIFARDGNGNLPLHTACRYFGRHNNPEEVIRFLTRRYPLAWATANYNGEYPLHILLVGKEHVPNMDMATCIIYENVERCQTSACQEMSTTTTTTTTTTKRTKEYPLHMYLRKLKYMRAYWQSQICLKARLVAQKLAEYCPEAIETMSPVDGQLPIHLACSQPSSVFDLQTIQAMHRGDTISALSFPERKLPIQYALENNYYKKKWDIIFYLCLQFPSGFITTTFPNSENNETSDNSAATVPAREEIKMNSSQGIQGEESNGKSIGCDNVVVRCKNLGPLE
ncbi:hypothetical protein ACA910_021794 [Epithemia clementina (nom. ined.)]